MKRREFLRSITTAGVGAGALAACGGPTGEAPAVQTRPRVQWRLASSFPRSLDTIYGGAVVLADRVEALSERRFTIRPYPSGELVGGLEVLDAVQQGSVQVGHTASYYFTGKNKALAFDTAMPFGLSSRQQNAWLYEGGGLELMREVYADFGIIHFPAGNTGTQMGGWFKRQLRGLADLGGLQMRIPGLGGEVLSRLGVGVQVFAGGEIYQALERGAIDAAEWVGPYDDEKLGFNQVASVYHYPGFWEPGPTLSALVNRAAWDKLPKLYQEIFASAARESNLVMLSRYDSLNPAALARIKAGGTEVHPFPTEILEASRKVAEELMDEYAAADPAYRKILDAWRVFRRDSYSWFSTAEQAFAGFSFPGEKA